jgi:hypothetical protein
VEKVKSEVFIDWVHRPLDEGNSDSDLDPPNRSPVSFPVTRLLTRLIHPPFRCSILNRLENWIVVACARIEQQRNSLRQSNSSDRLFSFEGDPVRGR